MPTLRFFPGSVGSNIAEQATVSVNLLLDKYKPLLYALRGLRERIPINQYRQLSRYLDEIEWTGDINTSINGIPFIHFLVRVYYLCTDDAAHLSVLEDVYDVIMRFSAQIPNFDINILDNDGNTPLMRVL